MLPLDWDNTTTKMLGVSRSKRFGGWLAVLMLNHRQNQFGPFHTSMIEASDCYSRLARYFLPFVKERLQLDVPLAVFNAYQDCDAEAMYGSARLRRLKDKLTAEYVAEGRNICDEAEKRMNYLASPGSVLVLPACSASVNNKLIEIDKITVKLMQLRTKLQERVMSLPISASDRVRICESLQRTVVKIRTAQEDVTLLLDEVKESLAV
jgi:hypothetical protein